MSLNM